MITKEEIKKEIDKLPDNLLDQVYELLKKIVIDKRAQHKNLTIRNFQGKLDAVDIRKEAYE